MPFLTTETSTLVLAPSSACTASPSSLQCLDGSLFTTLHFRLHYFCYLYLFLFTHDGSVIPKRDGCTSVGPPQLLTKNPTLHQPQQMRPGTPRLWLLPFSWDKHTWSGRLFCSVSNPGMWKAAWPRYSPIHGCAGGAPEHHPPCRLRHPCNGMSGREEMVSTLGGSCWNSFLNVFLEWCWQVPSDKMGPWRGRVWALLPNCIWTQLLTSTSFLISGRTPTFPLAHLALVLHCGALSTSGRKNCSIWKLWERRRLEADGFTAYSYGPDLPLMQRFSLCTNVLSCSCSKLKYSWGHGLCSQQ